MHGSTLMGGGGWWWWWGFWSIGRISPSSCCQIGFVAMRGPPQHPAQHRHAHQSFPPPDSRALLRLSAKASCRRAEPTGAGAPRRTDNSPDWQARTGSSARVRGGWRRGAGKLLSVRNVRISYCISAWPLTQVHNPPIVEGKPLFSVHSISALFTIPATGKHTPFVLSHSIHKLP